MAGIDSVYSDRISYISSGSTVTKVIMDNPDQVPDVFKMVMGSGEEVTCVTTVKQEYSDAIFSAGVADGHPHDNLFISLIRDGKRESVLFFRPDEITCLIWVASGALWSHLIMELQAKGEVKFEQNNPG